MDCPPKKLFIRKVCSYHEAIMLRPLQVTSTIWWIAIYDRKYSASRVRGFAWKILAHMMMTSWHANAFCITGALWRDLSVTDWFPSQRANNADRQILLINGPKCGTVVLPFLLFCTIFEKKKFRWLETSCRSCNVTTLITRPTLERRATLGHLRSINPNMINHFASPSKTCQLFEN